jgi:hypothetical protein
MAFACRPSDRRRLHPVQHRPPARRGGRRSDPDHGGPRRRRDDARPQAAPPRCRSRHPRRRADLARAATGRPAAREPRRSCRPTVCGVPRMTPPACGVPRMTPPGGRLRLQERQDRPGQHRRQDNPQKYNGDNNGSNDYRSESFHHFPYLDYVQLPGSGRSADLPGDSRAAEERPVPDSAEHHSRLGEPTSHSHVTAGDPCPRRGSRRRSARPAWWIASCSSRVASAGALGARLGANHANM